MSGRYWLSIGLGCAGLASFTSGLLLAKNGIEDMQDCYYDFLASKEDMYDTACKGMCKVAGGAGLAGVGGALIGIAIGEAYGTGFDDALPNAPVVLTADTIEAAQENLDIMKKISES